MIAPLTQNISDLAQAHQTLPDGPYGVFVRIFLMIASETRKVKKSHLHLLRASENDAF
jgi:hypothetical protein